MSWFVDTSAILPYLDRSDGDHAEVVSAWNRAFAAADQLFTSNYVLVETHALVQRRLGMQAVRDLVSTLLPLLHIRWVDEDLHAAAEAALLTSGRRGLSLVDCSSFEMMRRLGLRKALALDQDFANQGFDVSP